MPMKMPLAMPLAATLLVSAAGIANACTAGQPWYEPCGLFGTRECVCDCYGQTDQDNGIPVNCRPIN
jgi:hypothetical protein